MRKPALTLKTDSSEPDTYIARPPRFAIRASLHYRRSGELEWRSGTTINISRSGVLFTAGRDLLPETVLEMRIVFPAEVTGEVPSRIVCWGSIVRTIQRSPSENRPALAATIAQYRFGHS